MTRPAFDSIDHTLFCNAAVPGATSARRPAASGAAGADPIGHGGFNPKYVTLTVGGNDLLSILRYIQTNPDPSTVVPFATQVITQYGRNLGAILFQLRTRPSRMPRCSWRTSTRFPRLKRCVPLAGPMIAFFNDVINQVAGQFPTNVHVVDVHAAFLGRRNLLLGERSRRLAVRDASDATRAIR